MLIQTWQQEESDDHWRQGRSEAVWYISVNLDGQDKEATRHGPDTIRHDGEVRVSSKVFYLLCKDERMDGSNRTAL
jgi:hypothetical protein